MKDVIKKYIVALGVIAVMTSCNKDLEEIIDPPKVDVEDPINHGPLEFDARLNESNTFKVGDTVKFILEGNATMVDFYSGVTGNDYAFRETDRFYDIIARLNFDSNKTPANASPSNIDCADLLYTTDFDGTYTYDNIKNTNWTPITSRFNLQTELQATNAIYAPSGNVDVSDLFEEGKPVYFAWLCKTQAETNRAQFRVQNFTLTGEVVGNSTLSSQLYSHGQFGFTWYENEASAAQTSNRPTSTSTMLTWNGAFNNTTGPYKEGYAVSGPIELPQFNAGTDKPRVLIMKQTEDVQEHRFIYNKAGNYEVVFIASGFSANSGAQEEIMKKINITVIE